MKKRLCLFAALALLVALLSGCGGAKRAASTADMAVAPASASQTLDVQFSEAVGEQVTNTSKALGAQKGGADQGAANADAIGITSSGSMESESNAILAERKVIRKANVSIEVENFDEAYSRINTIITGIGYIQESNINADKVYRDSAEKLVKHGVIVLRVDKDRFESVLNSVKGIGTVLGENRGVEEVTDKFYDIESSLRLLKYEQGRLEAYLLKLDDPDKIFKTESRLTEIRHEIESLTVNLNKLSNLVDLATITINLNEKLPGNTKPAGYGDKLLDRFLESIKGVVNFCGEFLILLVQLIPVLLLLGIFVLLGILIYRKVSKLTGKNRDRSNNDKGAPPAPPTN